MESNRVRTRRVHHEVFETIDVQWNFTEDEYNTFRNWFIAELDQGVLRFQMVTLELSPTDTVMEVTRVLAFLDGTYNFNRSDNLFTVTATLEVDQEDSDLPNPPEPPPIVEHPWDPPPVITYPDPVCKDEIDVELPPTEGLLNVVVEYSDSADGPWTFWGESLQALTSLRLGNYFSGKWVKIKGQLEDATILANVFQFDPPAVLPPELSVESGHYHFSEFGFIVDWTPAELSTHPLIYSAQSVLDNSRVIAALYPGNLTHPETSRHNYQVELFDSAFVECGPRYEFPMPDDGSYGRAKITLTSEQDGVSFSITTDGTDPTEENGFASGTEIGLNTTYPYAICRAFKDGCRSAPLYVPLDSRTAASVSPLAYVGDSSHTCQCNTYVWTETFPDSGICTLTDLGALVGASCGSPPSAPCTMPPHFWEDAVAAACEDAAGGSPYARGPGQMRGLQTITPLGFYTGIGYGYNGPNPGTCPSGFWGGGWWKVELEVWYLGAMTYTWSNGPYQFRPADMEFFLGELYFTVATVPNTIPAAGDERKLITALAGPDGGTLNDVAEKAFEMAPGESTVCPGDGIEYLLTGFDITASCCNW